MKLGRILYLLLLAGGAGVLAGLASYVFLELLHWASTGFLAHSHRLYFLPIAGLVTYGLYNRYGSAVVSGSNLLIDEIHNPKNPVPLRMAPLILFTTVLSHYCGASVGREGTAVQMGGALADQISKQVRISARERALLMVCGLSAGFSAVFGTPLAGWIFGMEVLQVGRLRYAALVPALLAAIVADQVCVGLGVTHEVYPLVSSTISQSSLLVIALLGVFAGLLARLFVAMVHTVERARLPSGFASLKVVAAGTLVVILLSIFSWEPCLGLSLPLLAMTFTQPLAWHLLAGKLILTVICVGGGFRGGEVTPLFVMGALLGNLMHQVTHLPQTVLVGSGFVAVFAGATNTPLSCVLMAMELFGSDIGGPAAVACVLSYLCSGHTGLYRSQRRKYAKHLPLRS